MGDVRQDLLRLPKGAPDERAVLYLPHQTLRVESDLSPGSGGLHETHIHVVIRERAEMEDICAQSAQVRRFERRRDCTRQLRARPQISAVVAILEDRSSGARQRDDCRALASQLLE